MRKMHGAGSCRPGASDAQPAGGGGGTRAPPSSVRRRERGANPGRKIRDVRKGRLRAALARGVAFRGRVCEGRSVSYWSKSLPQEQAGVPRRRFCADVRRRRARLGRVCGRLLRQTIYFSTRRSCAAPHARGRFGPGGGESAGGAPPSTQTAWETAWAGGGGAGGRVSTRRHARARDRARVRPGRAGAPAARRAGVSGRGGVAGPRRRGCRGEGFVKIPSAPARRSTPCRSYPAIVRRRNYLAPTGGEVKI